MADLASVQIIIPLPAQLDQAARYVRQAMSGYEPSSDPVHLVIVDLVNTEEPTPGQLDTRNLIIAALYGGAITRSDLIVRVSRSICPAEAVRPQIIMEVRQCPITPDLASPTGDTATG